MRRVFGLLLVGTWVALLGALAQKQAAPPFVDARGLPPVAAGEREEWFTVEREGQRVGHAHRTTARLPDGQRVSEEMVMALAMLGTPQTVHTTLVADTDASFALRSFRFAVVSPAAVFTATGTSDGRVLHVAYGQPGREDELSLPLTEPIHLPSTLRPRVLNGSRAPGTRYGVPVFNPLTLRSEPFVLTVEGTETMTTPDGPVEAVRVVEEHEGLEARAWLGPDGGSLREEGSLGFTLVRATREAALASVAALRPVDLAATARIPLTGTIVDPRATAHLVLRVRGEGASRLPDDPPRQRVAAGRIVIARETLPARLPLPIEAPAAVAAFLAAAPFVEADDPAIVATARRVVAEERDAVAAARRLVAWVHDHVEKAPSVTVPSARAVLAASRGDCNEHAVLLAALGRAAGIPTRVVVGALYQGDGFYYHAWNELWLGRWVSADATLAQLPVDATHVKLLDGGPERHGALAGLVGRLAFATEEVGS